VAGPQQKIAAATQLQAQVETAQQQAIAQQMAARAPAVPASAAPVLAAAPAVTDEVIAQPRRLGDLHEVGILSAKAMAALKAKLINMSERNT
jgi:hypothetical protein